MPMSLELKDVRLNVMISNYKKYKKHVFINPVVIDNIRERLGQSREGNCWGTTLFTIGAIESWRFVEGYAIEKWLVLNTEIISQCNGIKQRVFGDIAAFYYCTDLTNIAHTAFYVGDGLYWHQLNYYGPFEIVTTDELISEYGKYFNHVKPNDKEMWEETFL